MRTVVMSAVVSCAALLVACSSGSTDTSAAARETEDGGGPSGSSGSSGPSGSSGTTPDSGTATDSGNSGTPGAPVNAVSGTLGGAAFTMKSGIAYVDTGAGGKIDLILSSEAMLCDSAKQKKLHAGESLVQAFALEGTAPGTFMSVEQIPKYATIASTCTGGAPITADKASRAETATITFSSVTSTFVTGAITASFKDGSTVTGNFSVPVCPATLVEGTVCF